VSLPINGPDWQVMRLSRDRNWGHPRLLDFLERFANDARHLDHWPGLLVGDMSQPRGGPMVTGHTSHQIGLDVDIWLTPMPDRILTPQERENMTAVSMLKDPFTVDPDKWTPLHTKSHQARGVLSRGGPHLCASSHQESAVRTSRQ
jgi:penicillin-insensitive murein endopeptidase